jgi:hypothetical protein
MDADEVLPPNEVSEDEPLPGLEVTCSQHRRHSLPVEGVNDVSQGGPLSEWFVEGYQEWLLDELEGWKLSRSPQDPIALQGGEVCDRCDRLAMFVTEHIVREASASMGSARHLSGWRSEVLMWCARHLRKHELQLLSSNAVIVGVRGEPPSG